MKNKWLIASILIVALIVLCGAGLLAVWSGVRLAQNNGLRFQLGVNDVSAKATEQKTITISDPASLSVTTDFGDIQVTGGGRDGQISVTAEKTAWGRNDAEAQAALKNLTVVYDQSGSSLAISVRQPAEVNALQMNSNGGSVNFIIVVPTQTAVTLKSSSGALSLSGTSGAADLRTDFGELNLSDVAAKIFAKSSNGALNISNIGDGHKIELSSEFGSITLNGAQGDDVSISSNKGTLELKDVRAAGLLKLTTEFGEIHLTQGSAKIAEVHTNNGTLKLEDLDVAGAITVKSDFGDLSLTSVMADRYDLNSQNGKISIDGARGTLIASSDFGLVDVRNAQDVTATLSSKNGGVSFSGSLGDGPHTISSEFGNIKLVLPAQSAFDVDLQTDMGEIASDFEITVSGKQMDQKHWTGKLNGGGAELTITNDNGNITLKSSK